MARVLFTVVYRLVRAMFAGFFLAVIWHSFIEFFKKSKRDVR